LRKRLVSTLEPMKCDILVSRDCFRMGQLVHRYTEDFEVGVGKTPEDGQEVTFHYVAYNENGGTIDSTYRKNIPANTRLGINGMIPGFEEGLKGMREGGRRRVVVPPELGPPIGPATFFSSKQWEVFDIELIKIKSCERVQTNFMSSSVVCE
jgi:FKBP-type peptidyl-prolyl cis-trans isomerase